GLPPGRHHRIEPVVFGLAPATGGIPLALTATPTLEPDPRLSRGELVVLSRLPWPPAVRALVQAAQPAVAQAAPAALPLPFPDVRRDLLLGHSGRACQRWNNHRLRGGLDVEAWPGD